MTANGHGMYLNVSKTKRRSSVEQMHGMIDYIYHVVKETGCFLNSRSWDYLVENFNDKGPPKDSTKWRRAWGDLCRRTELRYREIEVYAKNDQRIKQLLNPYEKKVIEVLEVCAGFRGKYNNLEEDTMNRDDNEEERSIFDENEETSRQTLMRIKNEYYSQNNGNNDKLDVVEFYLDKEHLTQEEIVRSVGSITEECVDQIEIDPQRLTNAKTIVDSRNFQYYTNSKSTEEEGTTTTTTTTTTTSTEPTTSSSSSSSQRRRGSDSQSPLSLLSTRVKRTKLSSVETEDRSSSFDKEHEIYQEFGRYVARTILGLPNSKTRIIAKHKILRTLMEIEVNAFEETNDK